jgi:hypothetical protein
MLARASRLVKRAPERRGRRQPQPADFQVRVDLLPVSIPILERELRAIETLLGSKLLDLLTHDEK